MISELSSLERYQIFSRVLAPMIKQKRAQRSGLYFRVWRDRAGWYSKKPVQSMSVKIDGAYNFSREEISYLRSFCDRYNGRFIFNEVPKGILQSKHPLTPRAQEELSIQLVSLKLEKAI